MSIESTEFNIGPAEGKKKSNEKEEPIIETDESILKSWEVLGLRNQINDKILGLENSAIALRSDTFRLTNARRLFNRMSPKSRGRFEKSIEEKITETENKDLKSILAIAFQELGVDSDNLEMIKEEKNENGGNFKYFKTGRKDIFLVYDGADWWIEKKEQIH